jgi:hypothetical protein
MNNLRDRAESIFAKIMTLPLSRVDKLNRLAQLTAFYRVNLQLQKDLEEELDQVSAVLPVNPMRTVYCYRSGYVSTEFPPGGPEELACRIRGRATCAPFFYGGKHGVQKGDVIVVWGLPEGIHLRVEYVF